MPRDTSYKIIQPLYFVLNLVALIPPYSNATDEKVLRKYRIRGIVNSVIIICCYALTINIMTAQVQTVQQVLYMISYTLATLYCAADICITVFCTSPYFTRFFSAFERVDEYFGIRSTRISRYKRFITECIAIHSVYFCFTITNHVTILHLKFYIHLKRIFYECQQYFSILMSLLIYNCCRLLNMRFTKLNKYLSEDIYLCLNSSKQSRDNKEDAFEKLKNAKRVYNQLCGLTVLFNKMFGWPLLFSFGILTVQILEVINLQLEHNPIGNQLRITLGLWTFMNTVSFLLIM